MRTTMDRFGRLVIPKKVREAAGIKPGAPLEVRAEDGRVEIEQAAVEVRIEVAEDGLPVLVADGEMPTVTTEEVRRTLEEIRRERGTVRE